MRLVKHSHSARRPLAAADKVSSERCLADTRPCCPNLLGVSAKPPFGFQQTFQHRQRIQEQLIRLCVYLRHDRER